MSINNKRFSYAPYLKDTILILVQVPSEEIGFVNSVTEGYEGVALVRTRDKVKGILEFWVIEEFVEIFMNLLQGLENEIPLRRLIQEDGENSKER